MLDETIRLAPSEYVLAMHDFAPEHQNANCLSFQAGQVIHVLNRDNSGWWDGELEGKRGWFPSNYVNEQSPNTSLRDEEPPNLTVSFYLDTIIEIFTSYAHSDDGMTTTAKDRQCLLSHGRARPHHCNPLVVTTGH